MGEKDGAVNVSREEAMASLEEIRAAGRRARRVVEFGGAPELLWTWGVVWLIGYLATYGLVLTRHFRWINPVWWVLASLGIGLTVWICVRHPIHSLQDRNIGWMWLAVVAFGVLWVAFLNPGDPYGFHAFTATLIMFAWIMIGLISRSMIWAKLGALETALTAAGYFWLAPSPAFWLWMALAGGGMMLFAGAYIASLEKRRA
jgi:hypothetical protein